MTDSETDEILQRTCINEFQKEFYYFQGCFLSNKFKDVADEFEDFEVYNSDIWVTSFAKAGTTWTQEMVWLLANNLDYEQAKESLSKRFPFLEYKRISAIHDMSHLSHSIPAYLLNTLKFIESLPKEQRCIKSHLPWHLLPRQIQTKEKRPKIIHVTRNPYDVCVSYFHHYVLFMGYTGTFEEFCKLFLADKVMYSPYSSCVLSYWEQRHEENVLIIKYEDMKNDLRSIIKRVASFLDKTYTDEDIDKLVQHLSFDSMRDNAACNYQSSVDARNDKTGRFMRKGIVGDYKNAMSPDMIMEFKKWIKEKNIDLIYDEFV